MAQATGAFSTYKTGSTAQVGNREDLSDVLYDISPTETPFITAAKKGKATAINHEWLTDVLADAASNAHIEGDDTTAAKPTSRVRLGNYTQILKKSAVVTGTQEIVLKGGSIKSEMAYQCARRMKEIKRDLEYAILGVDNAKVVGDDTTAREMGSLSTYLAGVAFQDGGAGAVAPTGNGVDGMTGSLTPAAFTEAKLKTALEALWARSGEGNFMMFSGAKQRGIVSTFTGSSTRYATTDDKKLVASIDVYDGDYQTVTVVPDRYCITSKVFLVDPAFVEIADLRPIAKTDLARTGDSEKKQIIMETTLKVCNPLAHHQIANLSV